MPLQAATPEEVFRLFQDHANRVLNTTLTRYRLRFVTFGVKQEQALLAFLDRRRQPLAVPLSPSSWFLSLSQELQAIPEGKSHILKVRQYAYRLQRTASLVDEAEVRFEYVSRAVDPSARWSRHHVQFHRDSQSGSPDFSLSKLHIPTGGVTIEDVIRFLIADLGVPPLTEQWEEELRRSEEHTREWFFYMQPE